MEKKSLRRPKHSIIEVAEPEEEEAIIPMHCEVIMYLASFVKPQ
jgi:hypothetical protein